MSSLPEVGTDYIDSRLSACAVPLEALDNSNDTIPSGRIQDMATILCQRIRGGDLDR